MVNRINPDRFITNSTVKQYSQTGKIDAYYIANLSADAASQQIEMYSKLQGEDKKAWKAGFPIKKIYSKQKLLIGNLPTSPAVEQHNS